jgi:hypothetical protein
MQPPSGGFVVLVVFLSPFLGDYRLDVSKRKPPKWFGRRLAWFANLVVKHNWEGVSNFRRRDFQVGPEILSDSGFEDRRHRLNSANSFIQKDSFHAVHRKKYR